MLNESTIREYYNRGYWNQPMLAEATAHGYISMETYAKWDGIKWVFDADNPHKIYNLPTACLYNEFAKYHGKLYVCMPKSRGLEDGVIITADNFTDYMVEWEI